MRNAFFVQDLIELSNKKESKDLHLALQSFAKRIEFSGYYYDKFIEIHEQYECGNVSSALKFERYRLDIEAYSVAFLHNIHAACDSLPYLIYTVLGDMKTIKKSSSCVNDGKECKKEVTEQILDLEERGVGFNQSFFDSFKLSYPADDILHAKLLEFSKNDTFSKLRAFVNQSKHKYLTRVFFGLDGIYYDDFSYITFEGRKKVEHHVNKLDIQQFLKLCHNELFSLVFAIYKELFTTLENKNLRLGENKQ